jgi:hypothetical protein
MLFNKSGNRKIIVFKVDLPPFQYGISPIFHY